MDGSLRGVEEGEPEEQATRQCQLILNCNTRDKSYRVPISLLLWFFLILLGERRDANTGGNSKANCGWCLPLRRRGSGRGWFEAGSFATCFLFFSLLLRQCLPFAPCQTSPLNWRLGLLLLIL